MPTISTMKLKTMHKASCAMGRIDTYSLFLYGKIYKRSSV